MKRSRPWRGCCRRALIVFLAWYDLPGATAWNRSAGLLNQESRLRTYLFGNGYNPRVRPVLDSRQPVKVTLGLALTNILDVDLLNGIATLAVWLRAAWYDPQLDWNSTEHGDLTSSTAGVEEIWTPDFIIYNHVERFEKEIRHEETQVWLYSDGQGVYWSRPAVVRIAMAVDARDFPFDTQRIAVRMVGWSMNGHLQDLRMMQYTRRDPSAPGGKRRVTNGEIDTSPLEFDSSEFTVTSVPGAEDIYYYACCPEPWPEVQYNLLLVRKPFHYVQNVIIPTMVTTVISFTSALLPHECGERISLGITCMLVIVAIMVVSTDHVPISDTHTVLTTFYTGCFFFTLIALLSTLLSAIFYAQKFDGDDSGRRGTQFFRVILGMEHRSAVQWSFRIDQCFIAVVPMSFICFSAIVLTPKWSMVQIMVFMVFMLLAWIVITILVLLILYGIRRMLGHDTTQMKEAVLLRALSSSNCSKGSSRHLGHFGGGLFGHHHAEGSPPSSPPPEYGGKDVTVLDLDELEPEGDGKSRSIHRLPVPRLVVDQRSEEAMSKL